MRGSAKNSRDALEKHRALAVQKSAEARRGRSLSEERRAEMKVARRGHSHTPRKIPLWDVAEDALNGLSARASGIKRGVDDWSILSSRRGMGFARGWPGFYRHGEGLTRKHLMLFREDCGLTQKEAGGLLGTWITEKFRDHEDRFLSQGRTRHLGRVLSDMWDSVARDLCYGKGRGSGKLRQFLASEVRNIREKHPLLARAFQTLGESLRSRKVADDVSSILNWVCENAKLERARESVPAPMRTLLFFGLPLRDLLVARGHLGDVTHPRRFASELLARDYGAATNRIEDVVTGKITPLDPRAMRQSVLSRLSAPPAPILGARRHKRGPDPTPFERTVKYTIGEKVERVLAKSPKRSKSAVSAARQAVAAEHSVEPDTIKEYHLAYLKWQRARGERG